VNKKFNISIFYILFFLAAVFLSAFVLLELREDYLAVLGSVAVLLISGYLLVDKLHEDILFFMSELQKGSKPSDEPEKEKLAPYLEEIQKIEKASYTAVKKNTLAGEDHYKELLYQMGQISDRIQQLMLAAEKSAENVPGKQLLQIQQQILDQDTENYQYQNNALKAVVKYNKENAKQVADSVKANTHDLLLQSETDTDRILEGLHLLGEQIIQLSMIQERINDKIDMIQETGIQSVVMEKEKEVLPDKPESAYKEVLPDKPEPVYKEVLPEKPEPADIPVLQTTKEVLPPSSADPNRSLSADEIAAMFAAAGAGSAAPAAEPAPPIKEVIPSAVTSAVPDTNAAGYDPNKQLSADEIAAMFAAANAK